MMSIMIMSRIELFSLNFFNYLILTALHEITLSDLQIELNNSGIMVAAQIIKSN